ncbi:50S ribosome-binding GTPase, partial [Alphaproteobacteria bacterium]|nr:50S ribosome-binding GTPase [Alphaproteobacteria bacterium]
MNYLLIGKPNVGKSSIYNILTGFDSNIIHKEIGTTRDWHSQNIKDSLIKLYDTPGILINDTNKKKILTSSFTKIIEKKINIFLYVIDYKDSFNEIDNFAIKKLHKFNKKIILIINKFDNFKHPPSSEIFRYRIKDKVFLSCVHRYGFNELRNILGVSKNNKHINNKNNADFSLAILGKPNVGKSSFLNTILGYERASTSPLAGTTSDYVSDKFYYKKKLFKVIDTAGISKKANIKQKSINFYSIKKTFENIYKVDVAIILIDSKEGLDKQDKKIINIVTDNAKSIILVFNKIDLIKNKKLFRKETIEQIDSTLSQIKNIKIFFISAFNKTDINKILSY